jgi:MFS family permease
VGDSVGDSVGDIVGDTVGDAVGGTVGRPRGRREPYVASGDRLISGPFVVVTLSALAFFTYIGVLIPIVPLFIEGPLHAGELGIGLNVAVFAIAAVAARPVIGRIADQRGRRLVMVGGALIAAVGGALSGQVDSLGLLLVCRAVTGIGEGAVFVGAATLIADLSPRHRRAEGASYFSVAVFTGLGLGPVLGEFVLSDTRFEEAFLVGGGFALLTAAVAVFVPSRVVSPDAAADGPARRDPDQQHGWRRLIHPEAVLPGIVLACGVGGLTAFFAFVPQYSRSVGLSSSGGLFLTYAAVSLVIRIFGARLPERLGPRRAVTIALTLISAGLIVFATIPEVWALWLASALIGFGVAFNYPSLMALTVNRVHDDERAMAVSSFTMFFEIGTATAGLLIGGFAQVVGKQTGFLGGVAFCLVGLWVLRTKVVPVGAPDAGPAVPQPESVGPPAVD